MNRTHPIREVWNRRSIQLTFVMGVRVSLWSSHITLLYRFHESQITRHWKGSYTFQTLPRLSRITDFRKGRVTTTGTLTVKILTIKKSLKNIEHWESIKMFFKKELIFANKSAHKEFQTSTYSLRLSTGAGSGWLNLRRSSPQTLR